VPWIPSAASEDVVGDDLEPGDTAIVDAAQ
jgi:hypothetical protein